MCFLEFVVRSAREALSKALSELGNLSPEKLVEDRYAKYRALGVFGE